MNCLTKEQLCLLFEGKIYADTSAMMYSHIALCDKCCNLYSNIAEENIEIAPKDFSSDILRQIKKGPITKKKLLAIYAVAAACVMIFVTSGTSDKLFTLAKQINSQNTKWSEKLNNTHINKIWEDYNHGIQN